MGNIPGRMQVRADWRRLIMILLAWETLSISLAASVFFIGYMVKISMDTYTLTDLLEALAQPGCPICYLAQRAVTHYIKALFYENVNDIKGREVIRTSLGYCKVHTWELLDASLGNALGVSIIYHDILTNILRRLPEPEPEPAKSGVALALGRFSRKFSDQVKASIQSVTPQAPCPACLLQENTAQLAVKALMHALTDEQVSAALSKSSGLCLPHLRLAFEKTSEPAALAVLLGDSRTRLARLDAQLAEYIRKNDYRFTHEGFGEERDAWKRVIALMGGEKLKSEK